MPQSDSQFHEVNQESEGSLSNSISNLDGFLHRNQYLFVLIGVFGSVSVYISNIDHNQPSSQIPLADLSMFSGFAIIFLLSSIILYKIYNSVTRENDVILVPENIPLLLFGQMFLLIVLVIFTVLIGYQNVLAGLLLLVIYASGFSLPFAIFIKLHDLGFKEYIRLSTPSFMFLYSSVLFYVIIWINRRMVSEYGVIDLAYDGGQSAPENFHLVSFQSFISMAIIGSAILFLLSVVIFFLHQVKNLFDLIKNWIHRFYGSK